MGNSYPENGKLQQIMLKNKYFYLYIGFDQRTEVCCLLLRAARVPLRSGHKEMVTAFSVMDFSAS